MEAPHGERVQAEYAALLLEKKVADENDRKARDEMKELLTVKANADRLMDHEDQEKEQETQRKQKKLNRS